MADSVNGQLDLLLLTALRARPAHGYLIIEDLRQASDGVFDLVESTVYPALHRLERDGLLDSNWAEVGGRRRRVYRLTKRGRAALGERSESWFRFSRAVNQTLGQAT